MSKSKGSSTESRLSRYVKAPIRLLIRARDMYVQRMTTCAGNMSFGGGHTDGTGLPSALNTTLPRNFSTSSSSSGSRSGSRSTRSTRSRSGSSVIGNDDFRELMRVASKRTLEEKFGIEITESPQQQHHHPQRLFSTSARMATALPNGMGVVPRSRSHTVGISRIDEDKPCDFAEELENHNSLNASNLFYPRSRSCATTVTKIPVLSSRHY